MTKCSTQDPSTSRCSDCKQEKPISEFHKDKNTPSGLSRHCKACKVTYGKKNRAKFSAARRAHGPANAIFHGAKVRAKKEGLPFNLEQSDIIVPDVCPLLGIPVFQGVGKVIPNSPSLDRIVPALGYIKGNVWVISYRANELKRDASLIEFETILKNWKAKVAT